MRIKAVKLGMAVTIANRVETYFDHKQNRCVLEFDKGMLTITAIGKAEDTKSFSIIILPANIAFMVPFEEGEEMFELPKITKK